MTKIQDVVCYLMLTELSTATQQMTEDEIQERFCLDDLLMLISFKDLKQDIYLCIKVPVCPRLENSVTFFRPSLSSKLSRRVLSSAFVHKSTVISCAAQYWIENVFFYNESRTM